MSSLLNKEQIDHFIHEGFIRIDDAFSTTIAEAVVDRLWQDIHFDRHNPATWTEPVVRLGMYAEQPFIDSVNNPQLHAIFDQLIGTNKWLPCRNVGTFPVRFPAHKQPADTGKHVDVGFPGSDPSNYFEWRANINSKGRALLMLALYSDVSEADAPTIIWRKSHQDVAKLLAHEGEKGLTFMELAVKLDTLPKREEATATGKAGTIYLCHPFIVHAAQAHRGEIPKFMAQPPLLLKDQLSIDGAGDNYAPVELAIRLAIQQQALRSGRC